MLKSMTGFGRGESSGDCYKIGVEIKSVNHRYRDIDLHLPKLFGAMETPIKKVVAASLARGKIDLFVSFEEHLPREKKISVDKDLAIAYHKALQELSQTLGIPAPDSVYAVAVYPEVLTADDTAADAAFFQESLLAAVAAAVRQAAEMRGVEGAHLEADLRARINILADTADAIEKRAPIIVEEYRARLAAKLEELLSAANFQVEEPRLLQEVLIFSEKISCTEEIVRLQSHFKQFRETMDLSVPVGRKLDFIVQEMNREVNTIASKANDAETVRLAVEMKSEIEKVREQVQNIE